MLVRSGKDLQSEDSAPMLSSTILTEWIISTSLKVSAKL